MEPWGSLEHGLRNADLYRGLKFIPKTHWRVIKHGNKKKTERFRSNANDMISYQYYGSCYQCIVCLTIYNSLLLWFFF